LDGFKNFQLASTNYSNAMNRFTQLYHTAKKYLVAGLIQTTSISHFLLIEGVQNNLSSKSGQKIKEKKKKDIGSHKHLIFY
jgi:hypothetical protein